MTLRQAALAWAASGVRVFPVQLVEDAPGKYRKVPGIKGSWPDLATTDREVIGTDWARLWRKPGAMIGTPLDLKICLDADVGGLSEKARVSLLVEIFNTLERDFGPLPEGTYQQRTRSGGRHVIMRIPEGVRLPHYIPRWRPHLDVKAGDRSFAVLWPSPRYQIEDGSAYTLCADELPELPARYVEALRIELPAISLEDLDKKEKPRADQG